MLGALLPRQAPGAPIPARDLNATRTLVEQLAGGVRPPRQVGAPPLGRQVTRFKITTVGGVYLTCRRWDGENTGVTDVLVARPYLLRTDLTAHNGVTFTYATVGGVIERTATSGADNETQVVVPAYAVGDEIFALRGILGGTGAEDGDDAVEWMDLNLDARAWALQA